MKAKYFILVCVPITLYFFCCYSYCAPINENMRFYNKDTVMITNASFSLIWKKKSDKYTNSFIVIKNCQKVIIDGIAVLQQNDNYIAHHSILIENCNKVIIKNSKFYGTCRYHIRIEGCKNVLIDNVKISGLNYENYGFRCGGGIWIDNGESLKKSGHDISSIRPRDLQSLKITNCTISDNLSSDIPRNLDGILIHSASNGIMYGCKIKNWLSGDAALDVSHRRTDNKYTNKKFLITDCVFENNKHVKATGSSNPSNVILWTNNIYIDTKIGCYHQGWNEKRVHESYLFTCPTFGFWRNWSILNGKVHIYGCFLHVMDGTIKEMYKMSEKTKSGAIDFIEADYNLYSFQSKPHYWYIKKSYNNNQIEPFLRDWQAWQTSNRDKNSLLLIRSADVDVVFKNGIEYPIYTGTELPEKAIISDAPEKDFFGKSREQFCYGAVCP